MPKQDTNDLRRGETVQLRITIVIIVSFTATLALA
jgi:hypothetical protein